MENTNQSATPNETPTSRFGGVARGGADLFRRAFSVAAQEEMNQIGENLREETVERITPMARSTGMMLAGGAIAAYGTIYVVNGIVRALSTRMPAWLASLLTGTVIALGGLALLESGRRQLSSSDSQTTADEPAVGAQPQVQ
ncbi:MAG: phage holin family protein [Chloroflexia bacterium]|nr:phage holin family protein [Chloroflexia bacterium]